MRIEFPHENVPDVWGEGILFGFSGMDGETNTRSGFVATAADRPYGFLFHTPRVRRLQIDMPAGGEVRCATGDVLVVGSGADDLVLAWQAWHTLTGSLPAGATAVFGVVGEERPVPPGETAVFPDPSAPDAVAVAVRDGRIAVAYGENADEARDRCSAGLAADLVAVVEGRLSWLATMPRLGDDGSDRLLRKCFSVMKVNTLSPEGAIPRSWSTPDRVPHKHMWLWDSGFHALGMAHFSSGLALDFVWAVLERAWTASDADVADDPERTGKISHCMQVDGARSSVTQPPVLAWAVLAAMYAEADRSALGEIIPRLEGYLGWDLNHRDANGNGLLEWQIDADPKCRSGESGLDNSPRFDEAATLDAVDFSSLAVHDMYCLRELCELAGETTKADVWRTRAAEREAAVHDLLWSEEDGLYYDRAMDGSPTGVKAVTGFFPLLLPHIDPERAARLAAMLHSEHFDALAPIPSVALTHPQYGTDMWRGPAWMNANFVVLRGLERQGLTEEAARLRERMLAVVRKYYEQCGVLFEYYDSSDRIPPHGCDRKGPHEDAPYMLTKQMSCIRDYHWTAAVTASVLIESRE
jgi:hypothetical protein